MFRGALGATLGIEKLILGVRNSILGMASHVLSCPKVHFKHLCFASGCVFKTVPINTQAAEVLNSDDSSDMSGPLMS